MFKSFLRDWRTFREKYNMNSAVFLSWTGLSDISSQVQDYNGISGCFSKLEKKNMTRNFWIWVNLIRRPKVTEADSFYVCLLLLKLFLFIILSSIFDLEKEIYVVYIFGFKLSTYGVYSWTLHLSQELKCIWGLKKVLIIQAKEDWIY